jgi:hypothetical protein
VLLHLAARIRDAAQGGAVSEALTTPTCRSIAASTVDSTVAERLLEALNPNEIALALAAAAADEVADRHQRVGRAAELAVDRARYEADRAERAFHAVEPENRLVARTLETRWETKLAALAEAEQAPEAARHTLPPLPARSELEKLAADLSGLWRASTTSNAGQAAPSTRTVAAPAMWSRTATEACAASPDSIASTISECRLTSHCVITAIPGIVRVDTERFLAASPRVSPTRTVRV